MKNIHIAQSQQDLEKKPIAAEHPRRSFETVDLNLASFLYCRSLPVLDLRRLDEEKTTFIFGDSQELRVALLDYANDGVVPDRLSSDQIFDTNRFSALGCPVQSPVFNLPDFGEFFGFRNFYSGKKLYTATMGPNPCL